LRLATPTFANSSLALVASPAPAGLGKAAAAGSGETPSFAATSSLTAIAGADVGVAARTGALGASAAGVDNTARSG